MYVQNSLATPLALTHHIHLPITADSDPAIPEFPDVEGMRLLRHLVAYAAGAPNVRTTALEVRLAPRLRGVWRQTAGIRPAVAGARPVSVRVRRSARRAEFATVWVAGGRGFAATLEVTYTEAGKWLITNWAIL